MLVRNRMSAPAVTITPDTVFRDAMRLMRHHGFRRLPVVDDSGKLVGIVSEGDLPQASPSHGPALSVWELNYILSSAEIRRVMTTDVISASPDTPIEDAARLMADHKIGGLPVVDEREHVVGVITETDIFKAFVEMFSGGHQGLRLTLAAPQNQEILLELSKAISELGGRILSVGSFYGQISGEQGLVVKVRDASKDQLIDVLDTLGDYVIDAREV